MAKPKHIVEYVALRFFLGLFAILPMDAASALGGFLMRSAGPRMGINKVARRNLKRVFPDWDDARLDATLAGMWDNLGRVAGEYPHLRQIGAKRVTLVNQDIIDSALARGPVLFVSGHLANWEVLPATLLARGIAMHSVYRAPNNPLTDKVLVKNRSLGESLRSFGKNRRGMMEVLKALQAGEHVGMLIDQKFNQGPDIEFFGAPARSSIAYAELAQKTGCTLLPGRIVRTGKCHFMVEAFPPLNVAGRDAKDVARDMHNLLEQWISQHPEQWLWLHRRWRD